MVLGLTLPEDDCLDDVGGRCVGVDLLLEDGDLAGGCGCCCIV